MTRTSGHLSGHALISEGAPHDELGVLVSSTWGFTGGPGRAKCSCGELSGELPSATKRKAWHWQHKDQIRGEAK